MDDQYEIGQKLGINSSNQIEQVMQLIPSLFSPNFDVESLLNATQLQTQTENREKQRIAGRLQGFNPKNNAVWHNITEKFGQNIKHQELLSIAKVISESAGIKLDRDAKRRKSVLIKWFEENWDNISHLINYIELEEVNSTK